MPTFIVPIKSFRLGKQRLGGVFDETERARLGHRLSDHVASTVLEAGYALLVVSSDPDVVLWADRAGHRHLEDPGRGLDAAAAAGVAFVSDIGGGWVVIHSDLPLLAVEDVALLAEVSESGSQPIAPSTDGGTAAVGGDGPMRFAFGPGSFHRHLTQLADPRVMVRLGLCLDVDSPPDLEAAAGVDPRWRLTS